MRILKNVMHAQGHGYHLFIQVGATVFLFFPATEQKHSQLRLVFFKPGERPFRERFRFRFWPAA
jgi:hypothetical protein